MVGLPNKPRRAFLTVAAGALLASGLLGCSSSGSDSSAATEPAASAAGTGAAGADAFPVTIPHRFGETTIDAEPERVVTVGLTDQDAVLALGTVPVGTAEWFGEQPGAIFPWATDELGDAPLPEIIKGVDGISLEKIAALRPDLILSIYGGLTEDEYDKLSQIAPTVAEPEGVVDYGVAWDDQTRVIGQALGQSGAADELIAGVEAEITAAREANPQFDGASAVMATVYDDMISIYSPQDMRGRFMESLGFELPPEIAELAGDDFSADVSMERVDLIDGDVVVWLINDLDTDVPQFEANDLYSGLAVHLEGRDVFLEMYEPVGAATSFVTVLSVPTLIDGLVPQLAAAVDGDPAT
jgi:iron complex transport system substrate-binding protein